MNVLRKLNRPVSATHASLSYVIRSQSETLVHSSGSTSPISTRIFNAGSLDHAASDFGLLGRYRPPNQHPLPQDRRRLLDLHCSGASKCSSRDAAYSSPDNGADRPADERARDTSSNRTRRSPLLLSQRGVKNRQVSRAGTLRLRSQSTQVSSRTARPGDVS